MSKMDLDQLKRKGWHRYSPESFLDERPDPKGRYFHMGPNGQREDLSGVKILGQGVDTLRQIFTGRGS